MGDFEGKELFSKNQLIILIRVGSNFRDYGGLCAQDRAQRET